MLCTSCKKQRLSERSLAPGAVALHVCRDAPSNPGDLGAQVPDSGVDLVSESLWLLRKSQAGAICSSSTELVAWKNERLI